jgi:hypothetical protein
MNVFIFQAVLSDDFRGDMQEGRQGTWLATRYQNYMSPKDYVFFWLAGDESIRGLYGWGVLTSSVKDDGVDFEYKVKFDKPILARDIRTDLVLKNLMIFRAPQASNFILDAKEAKRLLEVISKKGERVPDLGGQP